MEKNLITIDEIDYLADLSGLNFSDEEKEIMQGEVSGILSMLNTCADIEVEGSISASTVLLSDLRDDEVHRSLDKDIALSQVRECRGNYIVIPKGVLWEIYQYLK